MSLKNTDSEIIIHTLKQNLPNLIAIYAFGSQIKNTAHAMSDLDLAVLIAGTIEPLKLWKIANELANQLDTDIDLIDLRAASTVMQYQIISTGQLLYQQKNQIDLFRAFVLSEKTELDNARKNLLNRINRQGFIYGG